MSHGSESDGGWADHFSGQSSAYAEFRPTYPDALGEWLAMMAPSPNCVWDCATGNGQAATMLARHFTTVIATDASEAQIARAVPDDRITYRVASAYASGLPDTSCDVVTVAQAAHWFSLPEFYAEAARVLRPGGLLALWGYARLESDNPPLDAVVHDFQYRELAGWWPTGRELVDDEYRSLAFPWARIQSPPFTMSVRWTREQLLGYIASWSAVVRKRDASGRDPLLDLAPRLRALWPDDHDVRAIRWPLFMHCARLR